MDHPVLSEIIIRKYLSNRWQCHGHEIFGRFDLGSMGSGFEVEVGTLLVGEFPEEDCGGGGFILDPPLQSLFPLLLAMLAARVLVSLGYSERSIWGFGWMWRR